MIDKPVSFHPKPLSPHTKSASLMKCQEISRQIGFLRFSSLDESRAFVEENFPSIRLYGRKSDRGDRATRVRIAYSREREDRRSRAEGEWTCKMVGHIQTPTVKVVISNLR